MGVVIAAALDPLWDRMPPAWVRRAESAALMRVFARAFDVEAPAPATLGAFRAFTAACMEAALADPQLAASYRERLGKGAYGLGSKVRAALGLRGSEAGGSRQAERAFRVTRFFYRGIGIELSGALPGNLRFGPCYFAERYTPADCYFMSAFDEGFMRGIIGDPDGSLAFTCRLTEGAPCCRARFGQGPELGRIGGGSRHKGDQR